MQEMNLKKELLTVSRALGRWDVRYFTVSGYEDIAKELWLNPT